MGGSSPLARGLRSTRRRHPWRPRIIPARAGFTGNEMGITGEKRDHPRSRGVYLLHSLCSCSHTGSSPLARGLHKYTVECIMDYRIIPARAGFTRTTWPAPSVAADHPRSRGVYHAPSSKASDFAGSSPLARGLHEAHPNSGPIRRIIPARAGFTAWLTFIYI